MSILMISDIARSDAAVGVKSAQQVDELSGHRICIVTEDLSGTPDEGVKKFTLALAAALDAKHDVTLISTLGRAPLPSAQLASAPRTFISRSLLQTLRSRCPDTIVYAARPSTTFSSFLRSRVLKLYCPGSKVVLLGLQTRHHAVWQQRLLKHLSPDLICVQATASQHYFAALGCRAETLPSGVDTETFAPVSAERQRELLDLYGLDPTRPVLLHVGHLKAGRGVRVLAELARQPSVQVVLVTSTTTAHEAEAGLADELRHAGVTVISSFQPHIEHFYQLASCYVFPVASDGNAIEVPLSVLEALSCDLPVVTTRFGGLPRMLPDGSSPGLVYADSQQALTAEALRLAGTARSISTRPVVLPYSWGAVADRLVQQALDGKRSA